MRRPLLHLAAWLALGCAIGADLPPAWAWRLLACAVPLLVLGSARVRIERKDAPASANVMSPLENALAAAALESPPIKASIPPAMSERPRHPTPAASDR